MVDKEKVKNMVLSLGKDSVENFLKVDKFFRDNGVEKSDYLFVLTNDDYGYAYSCYVAMEALLTVGKISPNFINEKGYNFIQNAIANGYHMKYVYNLCYMILEDDSIEEKLNINHVDSKGCSLIHSIIYQNSMKGDLRDICNLFKEHNFNFNIRDSFGNDIVGAMKVRRQTSDKYTLDDISMMENFINSITSTDIKGVDMLLSDLGDDYSENAKILDAGLKKLGYHRDEYLFVLVEKNRDEKMVLKAIKSLISSGKVVNKEDRLLGHVVQSAIYTGYSESFVIELMDFCFKNSVMWKKLNVNHIHMEEKETMLHSAIYSKEYDGDIENLYKFLLLWGFNSNIRDKYDRGIVEAMEYMKETYDKYSEEEISRVNKIFESKKNDCNVETKNDSSAQEFVKDILSQMKESFSENNSIIERMCNSRSDITYDDLLYMLGIEYYDEEKVMLAVRSLLYLGADVNYTVLNGNKNFVQRAIESGYSESFIFRVLSMFIKPFDLNGLDLNYVSSSGETILHSAIKSEKYKGSILKLYIKLVEHAFDSRVIDGEGHNIIEAVCNEQGRSGKFSKDEIDEIRDLYKKEMKRLNNFERFMNIAKGKEIYKPVEGKVEEEEYNISIDNNGEKEEKISDKAIEELSEHGVVLNCKPFLSEPVIGREREMKALMVSLAQDKKCPIIVGESGVGKTVLVDELAYLIANGKVPSFLKNKIIYEVNPSDLVAGCKYVGQFEEKMKKMFEVAKKYDVILFIDEIHSMYGVGRSENKSVGMEDYIKRFIDRNNIKVIGTTTEEEYQKFMATDALKRRFEKIKVEEPSEDKLRIIIDKVIGDYCKKSKLDFENEDDRKLIVDVIIDSTDSKHRVHDDRVNNPDLAISIIDRAFAFAKYYDSENISKEHFMSSFEYCDRIYESTSESAIFRLKNDRKVDKEDRKARILEVDFTKFKR